MVLPYAVVKRKQIQWWLECRELVDNSPRGTFTEKMKELIRVVAEDKHKEEEA